ncbi:MAG: hypothetical protein RLZZ481_2713 [Pseudomonadota bacterium]|jgi:hypothetical protein
MNPVFVYPQSRFESAAMIDLRSREERARLSPSALKGFFNIVQRWQLEDDESRELLGSVSSSTYYEMKKNPSKTLGVDRITRVSYLIGIHKALHVLYGDPLADRWVKMPNTNMLFSAHSPLELMMQGGIVAMQQVKALLDSRRCGL